MLMRRGDNGDVGTGSRCPFPGPLRPCGVGPLIDTIFAPDTRARPVLVARARGRGDDLPRDARRKAIAETSAFLTWALAKERHLPRIPRRPVAQGGFTQLLNRPGARTVVRHWWGLTLQRLGKTDLL